ncbi:MAG: hypothetical protein DRP62_02675, partial [Planctomycetota bacterium]
IEPVRYVHPQLAQAITLANASAVRQTYNGTGIAVAIIDSGVDYTHERLGDGGFPNSKVIGGYDTGEDDSDPMPVGEAHGTCCAGIAGGDLGTVGDYIGGVAYNARIYALKMVTDDGLWPTDSALAAWDWCITHRDDDPDNPIKVMSNSWGIYSYPFDDPNEADAYSPAMTTAAESAVAAGITIVAASGNDGYAGDGISWPAAMSDVISVGAVYDINDQVTGYSNTADILDILAPADPVYTTDIVGPDGYDLGDYFPYFNGTSSACPFAAGAVAVLQSAAFEETGSYLTPATIRNILVASGDPVTDTKVAITKPRINLGAAIAGRPPFYVEQDCTIIGWDFNADTNSWDPNSDFGNIAEDPLFIGGYLLSQVAAGQLVDSNCVDAGSADSNDPNIGLDNYTTRTDSVGDANTVDMGYHYHPFVVPQYKLTIDDVNQVVIDPNIDPNDPNDGWYYQYTTVALKVSQPPAGYEVLWNGTDDDTIVDVNNTVMMDGDKTVIVTLVRNSYDLTIEVLGGNGRVSAEIDANTIIWDPNTRSVERGTIVELTAHPDEGYRLRQWNGTDNDNSTELTNTVTINGDRDVTVEFEQPQTLTVPGDAATIQEAIGIARENDVIKLLSGTYYGGGLIFDKEITITSTNPDDPNVVAATIIDCSGYANRGVYFTSDAGTGAVLNGITIVHGGWGGVTADDGDEDHPDGYDGGGTSGGGIYCASGSSPTIKNCVIRDCHMRGHNGGNGAAATENYNGGRGGWGGWARGGGVYIAADSNTTLINCTIRDCTVHGGNGGNGGNYAEGDGWYSHAGYGGNWSNDEYAPWQNWGYIGDYRFYSGYGGGVYCDANSTATFIACTITENSAQGGMSGIGGEREFSPRAEPVFSYEIPSYGGGVYCAANSAVEFIDCTITNNVSAKPGVDDANEVIYHLDPYLGHGGGVAFERTASVKFTNCHFSDNESALGGGMFWAEAAPEIVDCNIVNNTAYQGGGIFGSYGTGIIENCFISGNFAGAEPNDVDEVAGGGGGIYNSSMAADIFDCNITGNEASASGGGILITGTDVDSPTVRNCLLTYNEAGRDGGGISINWFAEPVISNCTLVGNRATGNFGELGNTGFGGGIYSAYESSSVIVDSILWDNFAYAYNGGDQLAIGTGFEYDPRPSVMDVSYSDIQGAQTNVFVDTGCTLNWGAGNIYADPCFVTGPLGDYYLSQTGTNDPNQTDDSPCVDVGSDTAGNVGLHLYTTRTDEVFDTNIVDMGYHYRLAHPIEQCSLSDLSGDGTINFVDFAVFCLHWLRDDCSTDNDWCDSADLTFDSYVNFDDLESLYECWFAEDTEAPLANPSRWEIEPYSTTTTPPYTVSMTAKPAFDAWGGVVEYYFECVTGNGSDRGWDPNRTHIDTNLNPDTVYGYRVKARDERGNETLWSAAGYAMTGVPGPAGPPEWVLPYTATPNSIEIEVTTSDSNGIKYVQYYFDEISDSNGGSDSGWQDEPNYIDIGLDPNTTYIYRVMALDENGNQTDWSDELETTTLEQGEEPNEPNEPNEPPVDNTPPEPNPSQWQVPPTRDANNWHYMEAVTASDANTGGNDPVWYYFECVSGNGVDSGWQLSPIYRYYHFTDCAYVVRTMDNVGNVGASSSSDGTWD